jgi:RES domain-containing protein
LVNIIEYVVIFLQYDSITAEIPTGLITVLDPQKLPAHWQDSPPLTATQLIGDEWIRNQTSAVLKAPSAIIPQHDSYLINPHHPDFSKIKIGKPRPFKFDPRFNKR